MVVMGVFGKAGAIFTTIPSPVIGGMFMVMFGVISAAGVSNLQVYTPNSFYNSNRNLPCVSTALNSFFCAVYFQYADMNSSRNIFIFGFSMFSGLVIPNWIIKNPKAITTGTQINALHTSPTHLQHILLSFIIRFQSNITRLMAHCNH